MSEETISVPVEEMSEEEKARLAEDEKKSELITEVLSSLRTELDYAYQKVSQATDQDSTDQLMEMTRTLADLVGKATHAAERLSGGGISEGVHSLMAVREVINHVTLAASDAAEATHAESATPTGFKLQSVRDQMAAASAALSHA